MMRLRLLVGLVAVACAVQVAHSAMHELLPYNARASDNATVVSGNARFTVLTDRLVRMEYSDDGHFEDRPSMAFVNRALPVPKFAASTNAGVLTITTAAVELSYTVGQAFSSASLRMRSTNSSSTFKAWSFGMANDGNLLGTIRSLDDIGGPISLNCTTNAATKVHDEHLHCEWGLVSRSGWSVVDDSDNAMWDETTGYVAETPVVRNRDTHDLYMFAHGNDFRGALYDFQLIGGKAAMVPRYVLGVMWSRWYDLSSYDIRKVVESYSSRSIPLDVFVLDMDWHPLPWSGYSFDKALFPFPSDAMGWLAHKGLHTAANLHDAMGVNSFEATYPAFAKALGVDPSSGATIEFDVVNATYMFNLEDLVLKPVADAGLDHWWIDWQQGGTQGGCTGGKHNPTILTNQVRATDPFRTHENTRTFLLSRFGGLGNHRYQVGFSGDVAHSWSSLAFQPYFSATATNVAFGYWSHDIIAAGTDHEMHTRWIQFGAYSGVFRSHDAGASGGGCADTSPPSCSIVEVWKVPTEYFEANRDALQARAALLPYLYTLARENYDSGVGPTRPMYYDFPSFDEAYLIDPNGNYAQYMIGSDMMVAPVVVPMDSDSQMATIEFWIPPGMWYEQTSGVLHKGPKKLRKAYALSEVPVFIRAGAVLPTVPVRAGDTLAMARRQFTKLIASIYPGDNAGSTSVYEDDGMSLDYTSDKFERTHISYTRKTGTSLSVSMSTTGNGFAGSEAKRAWEVRVVSSMMASKVTVDGHEVPYVRFGVSESATDAWSYDGVTLELIVALAPRNKNSAVTVDIETSATPAGFDFSGVRGAIAHAILCKLTVDADRTNVGSIQATTRLSTSGDALSYLAGHDSSAFSHALMETTMLQNMAATEVLNLRPDVVPDNALSQAYSDERRDTVLCGTNDCRTTNVAYSRQRIEGYQPKQGDTDVVPLKCYWNAATNDNYVTTETTIPAGYAPCDWDDGNVFSVAKANTAALDVYISSDHHHHLTTATPQGRDWATFNGYTLLHAAIGHVYTSSQGGSSTSSPPVGLTSPSRAAHCMSLMKNANNE